ncbi:hypothetical protein AMATHDRAFT_47476 [Amanita thiersii Skay4041]|uniref:PH domain-containing protein n=1 Tax=Amanita thiersii Skay4041 TaxID=703135 RepID=A0A2A9NIZ8_9AGAR|nr:hypothetical protein AMATHDRAFT_47476 [Amanita thiersii Skay4041]
MTLWADSAVTHKEWVESITKQQQVMGERSAIFATMTLSERLFVGVNSRDPVKVLALPDVTQTDVLEDYHLLILLSVTKVFILHQRAPSLYFSTGGAKSDRSNGWFETCKANFFPCIIL